MPQRRSLLVLAAAALGLGAAAAEDGVALHVDRVEEHGASGTGPMLLVLDRSSRSAFAAWSRRHIGRSVQFSVGGDPVLRAFVNGPVESGTIVLPAETGRRSGAIQLVLAHAKGMLTATALR